MRMISAAAILTILAAPLPAAAFATAGPATKAAALAAGDWRAAARMGASAAEVVRALQARGELADIVADEAVVTIGLDNHVDAVDIKPLPPLPADVATPGVRTAGLSGSGFEFTARPGSIVLYPPGSAEAFAAPSGRLVP
jgi:hypothetical protein